MGRRGYWGEGETGERGERGEWGKRKGEKEEWGDLGEVEMWEGRGRGGVYAPDLLEAKGGGKMSPVLEVLSMKSSSLLENRLRNASSRVESPALADPPSPVLPGKKKRTV